ncbi:Outer membrane protein beta-barrel domain-containing protein [Tenacibaculum mesophilum]|uniref:PorT family protein n=1 Tax=Tenacibaculum mesophilum TaxID=104268 RepID=A0ABN5T435_9FLAO|nr:porin family protein [Tenacibaculum mesophilum]AZJ31679.1 PorT family protein [Tenacibaculum mesophilum]QFS26933.1 outer membrane beta-barrel protein [Tenacibaculum mesophilum]SHG02438.1 Outer membrane protein beta-barrel domain-containing protein [Tenacibaculum mesophilum]
MKKAIFILCLLIGGSQLAQSQIQGGIKGGINYNSDSFSDVKNDVFDGAKSKTGFHAGAWLRIKLPATGLYIRPELVYTQLNNNVVYYPEGKSNNSTNNQNVSYEIQKIDIPVLLGLNFLKVGHVFAGPSFQYILDSDFNFKDLKQVNSDGFSVGLQLGAGIELGKLGLDVRWERALSDTESKFVDNNISENVNFDTRINQIIIGLSYRF